MNRRYVVLALVVLAQLLLVPVAVFGQLSARLTGDEYLVEVGPVDPIDPFRGAYVALSYPDLQPSDAVRKSLDDSHDEGRQVYVRLVEEQGVMVAGDIGRVRPADGPYLACNDRDWQLRCGIESLFLPQDKAAKVQKDINQSGLWTGEFEEYDENGNLIERPTPDSGYAARIKVDRWGHASVVALEKR
jgi:uncharacterized membrane-anchored protein